MGDCQELGLNFRDLSIRNKLTILMVTVSVLILLLVGSLYLADESYSSRTELVRKMETLGASLADSSHRLLLQRKAGEIEAILGSLKFQPEIRAAYMFDEAGSAVAQYLDPSAMPFVLATITRDFPDENDRFWATLTEPELTSSWRHQGYFLPLLDNDRPIGCLYLLCDLSHLYARLKKTGVAVLLLLGGLCIFSWGISGRLQRTVSQPLLSLVGTMELVSRNSDYSLRAEKQSGDEIGQLVDRFNQMLTQIEANRRELFEHQRSLEDTVEKRTEELRQVVSVLEVAKRQAEAANEAKSQFLANITHELRTPLIGVLGMNELMQRTEMDEQQQMLVSTVQNSGEDLLTLINNVLDFSKIEAGKLELEQQEFSIYQVVDEVAALLAGAAEKKGLAFYCRIPRQATCSVLGDKLRIRQILMNLVGNAIKFTEHGSVSLAVSCSMPDPARAAFRIEIVDTGIGINKELREDIFSAFSQADVSHTRKYGGTGLGLAIVTQLVQLLDGRIGLESSEGVGSRFQVDFSLPLVSTDGVGLDSSQRRQQVLLCMDDTEQRTLLNDRLRELGLMVTESDSVAQLCRKLDDLITAGEPPPLVFLSSQERTPEGMPVYLALRNQRYHNRVRRVLLLKQEELIELGPQEERIFLPVSWDRLLDVFNSRESLTGGLSPIVAIDEEKKGNAETGRKLLIVGGNAAERELIRISLEELPLPIDSQADLAGLELEQGPEAKNIVLLDVASFDTDQLLEFCRNHGQHQDLVALCTLTSECESLTPYLVGVLNKPFAVEAFQALLESTGLDLGVAGGRGE